MEKFYKDKIKAQNMLIEELTRIILTMKSREKGESCYVKESSKIPNFNRG